MQGIQSTYWKYVSDVETGRRPGDVGLADKTLFVSIGDNLKRFQGIEFRRGNVPKGVLKKLGERIADTEAPPNRDRKGRPKPKKLKFGELFYSRTKPSSPTGFWMQPSAEKTGTDRRSKLLLMTVDWQDAYGTLVPGWSRAVTEGAAGLEAAYEPRLQDALAAWRITP